MQNPDDRSASGAYDEQNANVLVDDDTARKDASEMLGQRRLPRARRTASIVIIDYNIVRVTHPTPTNTTLVLTIALELQIIRIGTSVRAKLYPRDRKQ